MTDEETIVEPYKISIEIGQTAKRENYIKSVKVRANTASEVGLLLENAIEQANYRVTQLNSGKVREEPL